MYRDTERVIWNKLHLRGEDKDNVSTIFCYINESWGRISFMMVFIYN